MESELFYQVDKLLDDEANKIVKVLLELYEKKTIVNKSMSKLVRELVDNKLKYIQCNFRRNNNERNKS